MASWFGVLARTDTRTGIRAVAAVASGMIPALVTFLFGLTELVDLMSTGTLLTYSLVATGVLVVEVKDEENVAGAQQEKGPAVEKLTLWGLLSRQPCVHAPPPPPAGLSRFAPRCLLCCYLSSAWRWLRGRFRFLEI